MVGNDSLHVLLNDPEWKAAFERWFAHVNAGALFDVDGVVVKVVLPFFKATSESYWEEFFNGSEPLLCLDAMTGDPLDVSSWEKMRALTPLEVLALGSG